MLALNHSSEFLSSQSSSLFNNVIDLSENNVMKSRLDISKPLACKRKSEFVSYIVGFIQDKPE